MEDTRATLIVRRALTEKQPEFPCYFADAIRRRTV